MKIWMVLGVLALTGVTFPGCDSTGAPVDVGGRDGVIDATADQRPPAELGPDGPGLTLDGPALDGTAVSPYTTARGLIHMHSIYSHDGCDSQGFINGVPNVQCLKELRDAVCANTFDFMFLTDHPDNMSKYTLQQDMLYDASQSDQLVLQGGQPIANRVTCAGGHQVLISVGFEATHMMPLGLHALPATPELYGGISDSSDMTQVKAQLAGLKALGAVAAMVHSEEADISASTIDAAGFEAMEWYNIHANIKMLMGSDLLSVNIQNITQLGALVSKLSGLTPFITAAPGEPHPDLVYLLLLDTLPQGGFDKWRAIQKTRSISGLLGSDIHRNMSVDSGMCAGALQAVCAGALTLVETLLGVKVPQAVKSLVLTGGTIDLSDGVRIDGYDRMMRWLENRVLVPTVDQLELQEALRKGRSYGVFTVFGDPAGFSFTATASGLAQPLQIGESAPGPLTLTVKAPPVPVQMRGAPFTAVAAQSAVLSVKLLRTDATGTSTVATAGALGATLTQQVSQPGAYHVELWITPKHLTTALGSSAALASKPYLWVITNPIRVMP